MIKEIKKLAQQNNSEIYFYTTTKKTTSCVELHTDTCTCIDFDPELHTVVDYQFMTAEELNETINANSEEIDEESAVIVLVTDKEN
jgi:uncharacterized cysteine cluster protein YcgN (CxxCxxCC family)